ncbi:potassium channel family protein [Stackebrandtia nassauensis]|uniref:Ion transport 2 domain protein n=1 Tax=Stackebrandtia nassauensis (strain DSM 44728 / CIP 108903 / NRRL B-16338 / NBRC 102104 / LLR-40K-21) TaxID=446470 RepID=D3PWC7_STANL|nr:potassium channel family protein [Stackebrandtia nassauensis]ADD41284.1 Ion transport 2 domain protein [Stackebrandtia nassauensis DSM 44728]
MFTKNSTARDERLPRVSAWERVSDLPLTILAIVFLLAYAIPIIFPDIPRRWHTILDYVDLAVWALFTVDYVRRLVIAEEKWYFVRTHLLDLAVVVLPPLRPLRLVRSAALLFSVVDRRTRAHPRRKMAILVGTTAVILLFLSALAALDAERGNPDAQIQSFGDALWWAIVTVSTVGYGDYFPVTVEGRLVAMTLMFGGVGLIGFITASVTSWVVEKLSKADKVADDTHDNVDLLLREVRQLRDEVAELRAEVGRRMPPASPG